MNGRWSRRGFLQGGLSATVAAMAARQAAAQEAAPEPASPPPEGAGWADAVGVSLTVNGAARTLDVHPDDSALRVVRDRLGLTGNKEACGHGACGACTMQLDGTPVATCLLPATALNGRALTTVEGLPADLHPVQRAFIAEDAMQCGYCTPGFVVAGAAFCDRWRAEKGAVEPSREEIASALGGHLCRCAAYEGIYRALGAACAGRYDDTAPDGPRVDAKAKVTGAAKYTVDVMLPGQLEGRILRATHGAGTVRRLDLSAAAAVPGVKAVKALVEVGARVRYAGQELAAVAAEDARAAEAGLRAIAVELDEAPVVASIDAARLEGAPLVYPVRSEGKHAPSAAEGPTFPGKWRGNVRGPVSSHFFNNPSDAKAAVAEGLSAGRAVQGTWRTQAQAHTALEPHAAVAHWEGEKLTVYLSTQGGRDMAHDIAERWELGPSDVVVFNEYVGGAFGAKTALGPEAVSAIELSRLAGAPVRVVLSRAEELMVGGYRPGQEMEVGVAAGPDGELAGMVGHIYADSGVSVGANCGMLMRIQYNTKARELFDYDIVYNGPPAKPFRGPGGVPAYFALEGAVDDLAHTLGTDPLALRRKWDPNPGRNRLYDRVEQDPLWTGRGPVAGGSGRFRRGVGVASGSWFYFLDTNTEVALRGDPDGTITASVACQDMGQGSRSVVAHVVASSLGLKPSAIKVRFGDSRDVPGPMCAGSRSTPALAPAAALAAEAFKAQLLDVATGELGLKEAAFGEGGVHHAGGTATLAELLAATRGLSVVGRRPRDAQGYFLPFGAMGVKVGKGIPGTVILSEVEIDSWLGRAVVTKVWGGFSVGRIQVPELARAQAIGGIIQGVSYSLYEEKRLDPRTGRLLTAGMEDYRIAGLGDVPDIQIHFDEQGFEETAAGGTGLAELVTVAVAGSVANAVFHATGWRPRRLPIRPDRLMEGLRA